MLLCFSFTYIFAFLLSWISEDLILLGTCVKTEGENTGHLAQIVLSACLGSYSFVCLLLGISFGNKMFLGLKEAAWLERDWTTRAQNARQLLALLSVTSRGFSCHNKFSTSFLVILILGENFVSTQPETETQGCRVIKSIASDQASLLSALERSDASTA